MQMGFDEQTMRDEAKTQTGGSHECVPSYHFILIPASSEKAQRQQRLGELDTA